MVLPVHHRRQLRSDRAAGPGTSGWAARSRDRPLARSLSCTSVACWALGARPNARRGGTGSGWEESRKCARDEIASERTVTPQLPAHFTEGDGRAHAFQQTRGIPACRAANRRCLASPRHACLPRCTPGSWAPVTCARGLSKQIARARAGDKQCNYPLGYPTSGVTPSFSLSAQTHSLLSLALSIRSGCT